MAKEKRMIEKEKEKIYYYEITGTIVILFVLITFSELGYVGGGLKSLLKILFGDYYFLLLFYLLITGIKALVKKTWFDFTSIKLNGFIIFFISLITLNHLGFYQRLNFDTNEIFKQSFNTYVNVLKNLIHINSYGGGIIGALVSQLLIFLFNSLGTIIILIVLMILSLSFMTSISYKTILYYISICYKKSRNIFIVIYKYFNSIKFPNKTVKKSKLNININMLDDVDETSNESIIQRITEEDKESLLYYLTKEGSIIDDIKIQIGYQVTRYIIKYKKINYDKLKLRQLLNNYIIYEQDNTIVIECNNKIKRLLTLKQVLLRSTKVSLGVEVNNDLIEFDQLKYKNLLIIGSENTGVKNFIRSFIISNIFVKKYDFKMIIIDLKQQFLELKYLPNLFSNYTNSKYEVLNILDNLAKELERRMDLLNSTRMIDYIHYNNTYKAEVIEEVYVLINDIDEMKNNNNLNENKLLYFIKFGYKVGIHFIIVNRNTNLDKEMISNVQTKLIFKCSSLSQSHTLLNNDNGCSLEQKADIILNNENNCLRITSAYISDRDYDKIISKFIIN